ncbi:6-phosphogluconate dehydrogenase, C-terminal-like protein, partial [Cynara cardunculus var. scolymus]
KHRNCRRVRALSFSSLSLLRPNPTSFLHCISSILLSSSFIFFVFLSLHSFMAPVNNNNNNGQINNNENPSKYKVTIVGSGNWGSVASKLIASNTLKLHSFHDEVKMWVFEEKLPSGEKLTDVINRTNENVKYLPGIKLGSNVVADPDLENAVGYRENREIADKWVQLFSTPYFMVSPCQDVEGVELCGTLKNVVAIAAGSFFDLLSIIFNSEKKERNKGFDGFDSYGQVGGRNRKCAEAFAKNGGKRFGVSTAKEVYEVLKHKGWLEMFPLFTTVHEICTGRLPPSAIVEYSEHAPKFPLVGGPTAFQ